MLPIFHLVLLRLSRRLRFLNPKPELLGFGAPGLGLPVFALSIIGSRLRASERFRRQIRLLYPIVAARSPGGLQVPGSNPILDSGAGHADESAGFIRREASGGPVMESVTPLPRQPRAPNLPHRPLKFLAPDTYTVVIAPALELLPAAQASAGQGGLRLIEQTCAVELPWRFISDPNRNETFRGFRLANKIFRKG